jgi:Fe-S-cluster containining protein
MENRKHFTDKVAYDTCLGNCCGVKGLKAACCNLDPNDLEHVLGPCDEKWISDTIKWLRSKGIMMGRADLVVDFEEGKLLGKTFFNDHQVFKSPSSYQFLRFKVDGMRFSCIFLNNESKKCTIYDHRPGFCASYLCKYVEANFLVKSKDPNHPNTWNKIR